MNRQTRKIIVTFLKNSKHKRHFSRNSSKKSKDAYEYFSKKYNKRPKFMRRKYSSMPLIVTAILSTVLVEGYIKYWVRNERKNGYSQVAEYKELREERREKRNYQKNNLEGEGKIVAHSPTEKKKKKDIDGHFKYILIGAGTASYYALKAIKLQDPEGEILVISEEDSFPYTRTPLSKELWNSEESLSSELKFLDGQGDCKKVDYLEESYYTKENHISFLKKTKAVDLNVTKKYIVLDDGRRFKFDKCLIATGASPITIPGAVGSEKITNFRTKDDFKKLSKIQQSKGDIIVIGGSFLGTELAYSLAKKGNKVTQVYLEQQNLVRNLPRYLGDEIGRILKSVRVKLVPNSNVVALSEGTDGTISVALDTGKVLSGHFVVTAVGVYPNTELAEIAGLEIDSVNHGIVTNAELEARNDIFVAGDCLSYHDITLGRRRSEHHLHAASTGTRAGLNMSGKKKPYVKLTPFWSSYGNTEFQALGVIDPRLDTYGVFNGVGIEQNGTNWYAAAGPVKASGYKKGIVYYLKGQRVVGVLMWNVKGKAKEAEKLLRGKKKYFIKADLDQEISLD